MSNMETNESLESRVDELISALTAAPEHEIRSEIRFRIETLGTPAAEPLTRHLGHPDCLTRWEVVNLLGALADASTASRLVEFALSEDEVHARWRSFWAVSCLAEDVTVPLLEAALADGGARRWRSALILSMLGSSKVGPVLLEGLGSKDTWVQWEALNALGALRLAGSVSAILPFLERPCSLELRQEAVLALGAIGTTEALHPLLGLLDDGEPQVRWRVALSLGGSDDPAWAEFLRRRLEIEPEPEVIRELESGIRSLELRAGSSNRCAEHR